MTATLFSRRHSRKTALAALALLAGFAISNTTLATELRAPAGKSKLLNDSDITIIIIDENEPRPSSRSSAPVRAENAPVRAPAGKVSRDEDEVTIRFRRERSAATGSGGTTKKPGPKVIIVDRNSNGCDGGGVCVIRP